MCLNASIIKHIFIKSKLKKLKIYTSKIKWVEALGDYINVVTEDDHHMVLSTMKLFQADLPEDKFIRVHKSFIVNIDNILDQKIMDFLYRQRMLRRSNLSLHSLTMGGQMQ